MSNWQPTNELRFVEREVWEDYEDRKRIGYLKRILQQKWECKYEYKLVVEIEWRDVPVEAEE